MACDNTWPPSTAHTSPPLTASCSAPASSGTSNDCRTRLIQLLRLQADVRLAGGLLLLVLLHPRLPALAGGGVAAGEFESRDVAIADDHLLVAVPGEESHLVI